MTPVFNHAPYLDDYFAGLLGQTYENVELVIFDDGSTDGSWEIIRAYVPSLQRKFTSVVAERRDNTGPTENLQRALELELMTGELMCILESDDYYLPTKLEENVRFLVEHPDTGLVHSDTDYIYPCGVEHAHWRRTRGGVPTGDVYEELLIENFVMTCAMCCRTELFRAHANLDEYIRRGYRARDYAFCLDLARHTRFGYIDKSLACYRVVAGSWSHPVGIEARLLYHRTNLRMKLDYLCDPAVSPPVAEEVRHEYHRFLYRLGLGLGRRADCLEGYRWLLSRYPSKYAALRHRLAVRLVGRQALWRPGLISLIPRAWFAFRDRQAQRAALRWSARGPSVDADVPPSGECRSDTSMPGLTGRARRTVSRLLSRALDPHYGHGPVQGVSAAALRRIPIQRVTCPCCGGRFARFVSGWDGLIHACAECGSDERHRLLWLYLQERTSLLTDEAAVLHWAPEPGLERNLCRLPNLSYTTADIDPRRAMVQMDITDIRAPADSYDVILCSHILEKIDDDRSALRELLRVLRPGGWAALLVPIDNGRTRTYPYGRDFAARVEQAGFDVTVDRWAETLGDAMVRRYQLSRKQHIYICRKPNGRQRTQAGGSPLNVPAEPDGAPGRIETTRAPS